MRKDEFLRKLEVLLSDISTEEREEALTFYRNYFEDAGEEKETDILVELESPEKVAEVIKRDLGMIVVQGENQDSCYSDNQTQQNTDTYYKWTNEQSDDTYEKYEDSEHAQREKEKRNKGIVVLVIIIGILTSPVLLGILTGILGTVIGLAASLAGITLAVFVFGVVLAGLGIAMLAGLGVALVSIPAGLVFIGAGLLVLALAMLLLLACVAVFGKFFPWVIKEIGRLCKIPFGKKGAQIV